MKFTDVYKIIKAFINSRHSSLMNKYSYLTNNITATTDKKVVARDAMGMKAKSK